MPRGTSGERRRGPPVGGRHGHAGADRREGAAAREGKDAALAAAFARARRPSRRGIPDRRPGRRPHGRRRPPASCARRPTPPTCGRLFAGVPLVVQEGDGLTGALATGVRGGGGGGGGGRARHHGRGDPGGGGRARGRRAGADARRRLRPDPDAPAPARQSSPAFAGRRAPCSTRPSPRAGPPASPSRCSIRWPTSTPWTTSRRSTSRARARPAPCWPTWADPHARPGPGDRVAAIAASVEEGDMSVIEHPVVDDALWGTIAAHSDSVDRESRFPGEAVAGLAEHGLLGLGVPADLGGPGGGPGEIVAAVERIASALLVDGDGVRHARDRHPDAARGLRRKRREPRRPARDRRRPPPDDPGLLRARDPQPLLGAGVAGHGGRDHVIVARAQVVGDVGGPCRLLRHRHRRCGRLRRSARDRALPDRRRRAGDHGRRAVRRSGPVRQRVERDRVRRRARRCRPPAGRARHRAWRS